ncbi:bacteriochlorophyll 4-vinyl reductase [Stappia sp.]|uniref:bacteriochlorophyll 4-vinyl reductase n=1 Tax=Stappia sp. TaxID=1870903 RepID=UPI0032D93336
MPEAAGAARVAPRPVDPGAARRAAASDPGAAPPARDTGARTDRIGPNAALQLAAALSDWRGDAVARALFARVGLVDWLDDPPGALVPAAPVERLYACLYADFPQDAARLAAEAGRRTADYVIANRIPAPVRGLLTALPPVLAAPLLIRAIEKNAWTFVGGGRLTVVSRKPATFALQDHPLTLPGVPWHAAVFARLFQVLVSPRARASVVEDRGLAGAAIAVSWT